MDRLDGWLIRPVLVAPDLGWGLFGPLREDGTRRLVATFHSLSAVARFAEVLEVPYLEVIGVPDEVSV